jgi:hypothetical protein
VPYQGRARLLRDGKQQANHAAVGPYGDRRGFAVQHLDDDRERGKGVEHLRVTDARCDAQQRHVADIGCEAAKAADGRERVHGDTGPPAFACQSGGEHVRSPQRNTVQASIVP